MIDHMNRTRRRHIVTIEDPIEILHPDRECIVSQREVGLDTRLVRRGAAARAPPGPGRDPDRRAARRRDRADGAPGGRVRAPRPLDAAHARRGRDVRPHGRVLPAREAGRDPLDPRRRPARRRQPAAAAARRRRPGRRGRGDGDERPDRRPDPRGPPREIPDALADGGYLQMQTFRGALVELVLTGKVEREVAATRPRPPRLPDRAPAARQRQRADEAATARRSSGAGRAARVRRSGLRVVPAG